MAVLGALLSVSLLLPVLIAFGMQENTTALRLLLYCVSGIFLSVSILLAIFGKTRGLERNDAILLAVSSWLFFPVVMAVPVSDIANLSFLDALFQTTSSFTTTGAMIFPNLETVPKSLIFTLAQLQWLGGLATLTTLILVLAPWEIGGLPQRASASIAASIISSHERLVSYCGRLFRSYLAATVICLAMLLLAGVNPLSATILSFSFISTGGITPVTDDLDILLGNSGMIIGALFLFIGATSIFWHQDVLNLRRLQIMRHRESYFIGLMILILTLFITYFLLNASGTRLRDAGLSTFSESIFNASSIVSTSAIQTRPGVFALLPPSMILVLIFMGGGCYSTAGGIKFFRIGGMFSLAKFELDKLVYPNSIRPAHFGETEYSIEFMKAVWTLFFVVIATLAFGICAMALQGLNFQPAFTASVAALSNAGPIYGSFWDFGTGIQWPAYFEMLDGQKLVLLALMVLGRLEVIAVFAALFVFIRSRW